MKRVIIESPYAGDIARNTEYARRCLKDSLDRGEAPLASHLLYPQVLDENDPEQRKQGIGAGLVWSLTQDARFMPGTVGHGLPDVAFYLDYGMSPGMVSAEEHATAHGQRIRLRTIGKNPGDADGQ